MVSVAGISVPMPLSVGSATAFLFNALITFFVVMVADLIMAHQMEAKRIFLMSIVSYFLVPIVVLAVGLFMSLPGAVAGYVVPLVVWIILGEVLLKSEFKKKALVAVIAFVLNLILTMFLLPYILFYIE